jgi:hypothetical protein
MKKSFWIVLLGILLSPVADAEHAGVTVRVAGPEEVVFLHSRDACRPDDTPDAAARAFRDAGGRVHLFATTLTNFGYLGSNLNHQKRVCQIVFQGANADDPARFDDREWLTSFWTTDGKTVFALVHNEFQGNRRLSLCPTRRYFDCWYNAIVGAVSNDDGFHFVRAGVVAAPIYRYNPVAGHPVGYFNPSNIVKHGDEYYAMIFAEGIGQQERGVCLLRTADIFRPNSWRAWDGKDFGVELSSPYLASAAEPNGHGCKIISPGVLILRFGAWYSMAQPEIISR